MNKNWKFSINITKYSDSKGNFYYWTSREYGINKNNILIETVVTSIVTPQFTSINKLRLIMCKDYNGEQVGTMVYWSDKDSIKRVREWLNSLQLMRNLL
jgi:hypothetical protein